MNIADCDRAYGELRRVLKRGAGFAFHNVVAAGTGIEPAYPTPLAETATESFLLDEARTRSALQAASLPVESWIDVTEEAAAAVARPWSDPPPSPTLATVMGPRFGAMAANLGRNLREDRLRMVMGRCTAR